MTIRSIFFLAAAAAALSLSACGGAANKCSKVTCTNGQLCDPVTGSCVTQGSAGGGTASTAGGTGTAGGSGSTAGGSSGTAGGTGSTAGGAGTAGGSGSNAGGSGSNAGGSGSNPFIDGGTVAGGETCLAPTLLTSSGLYMSTTQGLADDYQLDTNAAVAPCAGAGTIGAGDSVFQFDVVAGNRATFKVEAAFDIVLNLIAAPAASCGSVQGGTFSGMVCVAGADNGGAGDAETLVASAPGTYFAIVDGYDVTDVGDVTVTLYNQPIPVGDVCTAPTVIAASGTLNNQTTIGFGNDYDLDPSSTSCTGFEAPGLDRVYQVAVPPGLTLTATVTPVGAGAMDDVSLYFVGSPATNCVAMMTTCLAGKDEGVEADPETVTYTNSSGAAQNVFVIVDSFAAGAPSEFNLQVQVQ